MSNNVKIIITTRLNYINIAHTENCNVFNIELQNLELSDLEEMKNKYFELHNSISEYQEQGNENIAYLKRENTQDEILNVLAIPLLFYMILATKIAINNIKNLGELYDEIFEELYTRNYDVNLNSIYQTHNIKDIISTKLSRQVAIEIAYKMYQKNDLLLKVNSTEIENAISNAINSKFNLSTFSKGQIEKLFPITFFYKQNDDVVEFSHKSIMEFFTAEKLYQIFYQENSLISFLKEHLIRNKMTSEILEYWFYFIIKNKSKLNFEDYQNTIFSEINNIADNGDLYYCNKNDFSFNTSKIVFFLYWHFLKNIIKNNQDELNDLLGKKSISNYICGIMAINSKSDISLLNSDFFAWDYTYCNLNQYEFTHSLIDKVDFSYSEMNACSFKYSHLVKVQFENTEFIEKVNFTDCVLSTIVFKNCKNFVVDFSHSRLMFTRFSNISVIKGILKNTVFMNVIIETSSILLLSLEEIIFEELSVFHNVKMTFRQFSLILNKKQEIRNPEIHFDHNQMDTKDISNYIGKINEFKKNKTLELLEKSAEIKEESKNILKTLFVEKVSSNCKKNNYLMDFTTSIDYESIFKNIYLRSLK